MRACVRVYSQCRIVITLSNSSGENNLKLHKLQGFSDSDTGIFMVELYSITLHVSGLTGF